MNHGSYNLDDSLGYLVGRTAKALGNGLSRHFKEAGHDVTLEQWIVLVHLWRENGQNQQQLADTLGRDKTTITRVLDVLEKHNLVLRVPDQLDRRNKLVYLTNLGKNLQASLIAEAKDLLTYALRGIDPEELEICKRVLRKVYQNLEEQN